MNWKATYDDKSEYNSDEHKWEDLPSEGFIKLIITLPAGGKMGVSGWDFYALEEIEKGLKVSYWKDVVANDINGDPIEELYLDKGGFREFFDDGSANDVTYHDAIEVYEGIPETAIKAGRWVTDELAKELGVL